MRINLFRGEYYFLSNFYDAPVEYNGFTYKNNEAAFQAQKCRTDDERKPFTEMSGTEAKKAGRKVTLRSDWEAVKIDIMRGIVYAKFAQNPDLKEKLLATDNAYLEEGNTWGDKLWGTVNGEGANNLGRILMRVRRELEKEHSKPKEKQQGYDDE